MWFLEKKEQSSLLDLDHITYEATSDCRRGCIYCYNYWRSTAESKEPFSASYDQSIKTLKRLFGIYPVKHVTFTGGEPLLAERLEELILYVKLRGARVNLISGGGAPLESYRKLLDVPPDQVQMPYHSVNAGIHDAMMGSPGAHRAAVQRFAFFAEHSIRAISVLILTRLNVGTLQETLDEMKRMGIPAVLVNRFDPGGRGLAHVDELELAPKELNEAYALLNQYSTPSFVVYSGVNTPHCLLDKREYPRIGFGGCHVHAGKGPITLDTAGNLRLCNQSQHIIGNIYRDRLAQMELHPIFQMWRTAIPKECDGCSRFEDCQAGCRAAGEQMGMTAAEADPYLQRFKGLRKTWN